MNEIRFLGVPNTGIKGVTEFGSPDLGRVGNFYPTANLAFRIAPEGTALHSDALREAAASEEGWKATVLAAKAFALTAYDLLKHPEKVKRVQEKFKGLKEKEGK